MAATKEPRKRSLRLCVICVPIGTSVGILSVGDFIYVKTGGERLPFLPGGTKVAASFR